MSIDTKQLIHIAIETTVISVLFVYFYNKNKVLCEQINELESIVSEQQETLLHHEQMILNLSNSFQSLQRKDIVKKPALSIISSGDEEEEEDEDGGVDNEVPKIISLTPITELEEESKDKVEEVNVTKSDNKKKKKKKKKKVEATEQMLDAELLEELKDLE